ncbi:MAG: hypothetical protein A2Y53_00080 [Chloroflexi bacterium RBG_16_47_49]|nr:MAG: hypothetical protein A2Y53_00080 [Chloroflexi bacterium RBG_16_47_49]
MMRLPEQVREELQAKATETILMPLTKGAKGAIVGMLNKVCGNDRDRHELLKCLFGKQSTKELTEGEWVALERWIDVKQMGDKWLPQENLQDEVDCILGREPKVPYEFD